MKKAITFQGQPAVEIQDDDNSVIICPDHGARILRWTRQGQEVIIWPENADWSQILKVRGGNPVLFPFIARHFVDGVNEKWKDQNGVIRPMPQHGFARNAAFTVIDDTPENTLQMRLTATDETRPLYPFNFQFDVIVVLHPFSRLEIRFETQNLDQHPLPYYAGHHFYLAIPHADRVDWQLHLPCAGWGRQAPDGSVIHEEATATTLNLDDPALIDRYQIQPLDSKVTLRHIDGKRRLVFDLAPPGSVVWNAVTTWTEKPISDFFCIEPWLGLPNAIHHGEGLRHVPPGQTEVAACILDAGAWS